LVTGDPARLFTAAIVLAGAGDDKHAAAIAAGFAKDVSPSLRALAKLLDGEELRIHGKGQEAMTAVEESITLADTPYAHFLLARAALDAKQYPRALAELQVCQTRRGEGVISADDAPSLRYLPLLTYYLAKAQDGLGDPAAARTYAAFLAMLHEPDADDSLVVDARSHVH
jgi:hypothetical protein